MWDQIRRNKRNSIILLSLMALVLCVLGWLLAEAFVAPGTGPLGVAGAVALWGVLCAVAFAGGDKIVLSMAGAREITKADAPQLYNVVEEMTIASSLGTMPRVFIMDQEAPNAFAVGKPGNCAVAVTSGLMMRLNRDELQGVIAHEIGHIANRDTRFMVLAGVTMGSIVLLSDGMLRALFFTGGRRSRRSGGGGGGLVIVVALVAAILAPIMAQLIYFACSRKREYLADACGARFTRYPEGLASALEKIQHHALRDQGSREVNRIVAPMYIINPRALTRKAASLFSTHPETARRIDILRAMGGGAGYSDYETAYSRVTQGKLLDEKVLDSSDRVAVREPSAEPEQSAAEKTRSAVDILHKLEGMLFLSCACGLRMKAPKNYQGSHIACPRCGAEHLVPVMAAGAALEAATDAMDGGSSSSQSVTPPLPEKPQEVTLSGGGWQSVECRCGRSIQVSPSFMADRIDCRDCGRVIRIKRT